MHTSIGTKSNHREHREHRGHREIQFNLFFFFLCVLCVLGVLCAQSFAETPKEYPFPRTVNTIRGSPGSSRNFSRSLATCISIVRVSAPRASIRHTQDS